MEYNRAHNFSAGPSTLPASVLEKARDELLNYKGSGMSVMELSHRSSTFNDIIIRAENQLRTLLDIPSNYHILFFQGGGMGQFAATHLNLMASKHVRKKQLKLAEEGKKITKCDYLVTGAWSEGGIKDL